MATKRKSNELQPPPEPEYVPDIQEMGLDKRTLSQLSNLIIQHGELGYEKRKLEKERDKLTPEIKAILGEYQIGKCLCGEYRVAYFNVPRTSLSKELLLENGVPPAVIAACTVTKDVYTLKITPQGEKEES